MAMQLGPEWRDFNQLGEEVESTKVCLEYGNAPDGVRKLSAKMAPKLINLAR